MDIPECSICCEGLDDSVRRPRCLPCGHTICTMCIDMSIVKGDRTCPSCRQPHNVEAASNLPVNFFLEEMFQKMALKSCETSRNNTETSADVRKNKEIITSETNDYLYSIEIGIQELQNELILKASLIDSQQANLTQMLAEVECLKKDIQKEKEVKHEIEGTIDELEQKRSFLENSVGKIQKSRTSKEVFNIHEDVKRKLQMSTLCQDDAREDLNMNTARPTIVYQRINQIVHNDGGVGRGVIRQQQQRSPGFFKLPLLSDVLNLSKGVKPDRIKKSVRNERPPPVKEIGSVPWYSRGSEIDYLRSCHEACNIHRRF
ncbi:unnamed protein product, partial [Meganyctiphanes norvegica]